MTIKVAIETFKKTQNIPRECGINWLKENFNPILKEINPKINISWACGSCIKNNMNILMGWLDREQEKTINANKC